jgi:hypothetical protein
MKQEIENAVAVLLGKVLWGSHRASDMTIFQFGVRKKVTDFYGRVAEVGEYALHVQCPWRIAEEERVVVGSLDLYYPPDLKIADPVPHLDWDWESGNRQDELLKQMFQSGKSFQVQAIEVGAAASLHIVVREDFFLDVFPDDSVTSARHEHWRLLAPGTERPHFVITGSGIESA